MKYSIAGFDQQGLIDCGLDTVDAVLLKFLVNLQGAGGLTKRTDECGEVYYGLKHAHIAETLPIMGITSKQGISKRMKKLRNSGLIQLHTYRGPEGTFACYRITEKPGDLMYSNPPKSMKKNCDKRASTRHKMLSIKIQPQGSDKGQEACHEN